jgi:hypothetical protein
MAELWQPVDTASVTPKLDEDATDRQFEVSQRQSWRQRRRELTDAARSKRKKLEEMREFV